MSDTVEREVIETGKKNELGDELVVFNGISDMGTYGWFIGYRANLPEPYPQGTLNTIIFFPESDEYDAKEEAVKQANEDDDHGMGTYKKI